MQKVVLSLFLTLSLFADSADELLEGFDDAPKVDNSSKSLLDGFDEPNKTDDILDGFDDTPTESKTTNSKNLLQKLGIEGKFTQAISYSYNNKKPHDGLSSMKSSLFLEYNKELYKSFKLKVNGKAFYDAIFMLKREDKFTHEELDALRSEVELFDAYIQGAINDRLDIKVGRQVVVWGRSDSIRITDVLNPLDNRRPAMVDIEDLRLPETMVKLDYYKDAWRITPIVILEQRFNKNPPFGGEFYPSPKKFPSQNEPNDITYALDIGGEFSGFDVDFYLANIYAQDELGLPPLKIDNKINLAGVALNYIKGSWLIKAELAYKSDFMFLQTAKQKFDRVDTLLGVEYNGIADTKLSYDIANKHITDESPMFEQDSYQHAFRATSDFLNATLNVNYLVMLFGDKMDEGGFQRAWIKYDLADGINANFGVVDYMGGSKMFDAIKDNDMVFMDVSYSF
jgi:hypothetical protein